jgi:hypothetical protein
VWPETGQSCPLVGKTVQLFAWDRPKGERIRSLGIGSQDASLGLDLLILMTKLRRLIPGLVVVGFAAASYANVYYVATNGDDTANDGLSTAQPLATVGLALNKATYGDTIYLRGGTYRQSVQIPDFSAKTGGSATNMLHLVAYPGEQPVISGAVVITQAWAAVLQPVIATCSYAATSTNPVVVDDRIVGVTNLSIWSVPWTNRTQQVFFVTNAGAASESRFPLQQLGWSSPTLDWIYSTAPSLSDYRPPIQTNWTDWSFFWSTNGGGTLFVRLAGNLSPAAAGVTLEAGAVMPFQVPVDYLHVKGLKFRHSNNAASGLFGTGVQLGNYCLLENSVVEWMDLDGVSILQNCAISNCVIASSGRTGLDAPARFSLVYSVISSNNYRLFPNSHHAAGVKCIAFGNFPNDYGGTLVMSNQFLRNYGAGFWVDSQRNFTSGNFLICNNLFAFNAPPDPNPGAQIWGVGLFLENSGPSSGGEFRISNNVFTTNGLVNIRLINSCSCKIQNNTIITGIGAEGLEMSAMACRPVPSNNVFVNNIILQAAAYYPAYFFQTGVTKNGIRYDLTQSNIIDNNCYFCAQPGGVVVNACTDDYTYPNPSCQCSYNLSLSAFQQIVGSYLETSSVVGDPHLDARLRPALNSPVVGRAALSLARTQLFAVTQDYLGALRPRSPDIGAVNSQRPTRPEGMRVLSSTP